MRAPIKAYESVAWFAPEQPPTNDRDVLILSPEFESGSWPGWYDTSEEQWYEASGSVVDDVRAWAEMPGVEANMVSPEALARQVTEGVAQNG